MNNNSTNSPLAPGAETIAAKLRAAGFQALFAGGCVRDMIMGRAPKDIDVVTNAPPDMVQALFPRSVAVGKAFGVIRVGIRDKTSPDKTDYYEVATFRSDGAYRDGRRPQSVVFADEKTDAQRRDFTINSIFYDPLEKKFHDYAGGREDISRKIVRTVGDADERFREDHLRMLRAVRFVSTLAFSMEPETAAAIRRNATLINRVSAERIQQELTRTLIESEKAGDAFEMLSSLGLLKEILPELEKMRGQEQPPQFHPEGDVWTHTMLMLNAMRKPSPRLAYAVLLHDVGKPDTAVQAEDRIRFNRHASHGAHMTETILRRLRLPAADIKAVSFIVGNHMRFMDVRRMRRATLRRLVTAKTFADELELHRLDCEASHGDMQNYAFLKDFKTAFEAEPVLPPPLITGHDIMALKVGPGPRVGQVKKAAYDAQLEGKFNDRAGALDWLNRAISTNLDKL